MIEIVPTTQEHVRKVTGETMSKSCIAFTALEDGEPIGLGAIYNDQNRWGLISKMTPKMRNGLDTNLAYQRVLLKITRRLLKIAARRDMEVHAILEDGVERAEAYLEHFGFKEKVKGVFAWHGQPGQYQQY